MNAGPVHELSQRGQFSLRVVKGVQVKELVCEQDRRTDDAPSTAPASLKSRQNE